LVHAQLCSHIHTYLFIIQDKLSRHFRKRKECIRTEGLRGKIFASAEPTDLEVKNTTLRNKLFVSKIKLPLCLNK